MYNVLSYSYNFNPVKNIHLWHVTIHYLSCIVQSEVIFFLYWMSWNIHILFCIIQLLLRDKTHANVKKNKTMLKMVTILNEDENYE
jgi:hypothetical protein